MSDEQTFRIAYLSDAPEVLPVLVRWFVQEWAPWYGPDGPGNAEHDLKAYCNRHDLPIGLIALSSENHVLGTATLKSESVGSELDVGPWLAAVLVGENHRGEGIGSALVEAIETEAQRFGFDALYTSTDTAGSILTRRHWEEFGITDSLRGPVIIYRKQFHSTSP